MTTPGRFSHDACARDGNAEDGALVSLDTALFTALDLASPVTGTVSLAIGGATGRILAKSVYAPAALPEFDNAAMDGYALRTKDLPGEGPWLLPVAGRIAAGDPIGIALAPGTTARILTGAMVPPEADAVVMQEAVALRDGRIVLTARPEPGSNIRRRGEDLGQGDRILSEGIEIGPRQACALAYCGASDIEVRRKVRVAVFSTGSELRAPGTDLSPGQIWNCNLSMLKSALVQPWVDVIDLGTIPDRPDELVAALGSASRHSADLIVSTGGVSVGDKDHMRRVFRRAGGEISAMRIAMKPGKPVTIGLLGPAVFVGLPGNPVAAFVAWQVLGAVILGRLGGLAEPRLRMSRVKAGFGCIRSPGRCEFRPARISGRDPGGLDIVSLVSSSFSSRVALLTRADGLAVIPAEANQVLKGDLLEFIRF